MVEVKATTSNSESQYRIKKQVFDNYIKFWGNETILTIVYTKSMNIYCKALNEIKQEKLKIVSCYSLNQCYILDIDDFKPINHYFDLINPKEYQSIITFIREAISKFNQ